MQKPVFSVLNASGTVIAEFDFMDSVRAFLKGWGSHLTVQLTFPDLVESLGVDEVCETERQADLAGSRK